MVLPSVTVGELTLLRTSPSAGATSVGGSVGLTTPMPSQSEGIQGRVVNAGLLAIAGARITAYDAEQRVIGSAVSSIDGTFTIGTSIGAGFSLIVSAEGYVDGTRKEIVVTAGVINDQGDIVLSPAFGGSIPLPPPSPEPPQIILPPPVYPPFGPPVIWERPKTPPKIPPTTPPNNQQPPNENPPKPTDPPPKPNPDPTPKPNPNPNPNPNPPVPTPPPNPDCPDPCKDLEEQKKKLEELLKQKKDEQFTLKLQVIAQVEKVIAENIREATIHAIKSTQALEKLFGFKFPGLDQGLDSLKEILELPNNLQGKGPLEQGKAIAEALKNIVKNTSDAKKGGTKPSFDKPNIDDFLKDLEKLKNDKDAFKETLKEFDKAQKLIEKLKQKNREVEEIEKRLKKVCDDLANCEKDHNCKQR